ncbi:MAG TPA: alpha-(1-_3)-arabinofuranosyltransferase family protein [Ilumatobacter sp.]|nr:alpha-(1->3)-arabinofuranosyltransferase family protein [Ilumatobacter sp.]
MKWAGVQQVGLPRTTRRWALALLAAMAYLPALMSSPGRMPADTKLYLYLDPTRLTRLATSSWDPSQFGGWFPHQTTTYFWPSGPWFMFFDALRVPDWIAHRLFIGTMLFVAGWGVLRLCELLGLSLSAALTAAVIYEWSTYVLPYVSRTSLMLLPWASLGWLSVFTIRPMRESGWRPPAQFGLVIFTVAHVNPTAFLMIVPGPVIWVIGEMVSRRLDVRSALKSSARLVAVSSAVSLWWVVMLAVQAQYGADVLAYSETLESVSFTATANETVRGLGYWLFYIRDAFAPATASSVVYQENALVIIAGYSLVALGVFGVAVSRWRHRWYAAALFGAGAFLAIGVHPFDEPSPLMRIVRDSSLGLALRSSTRALPLMILGIALGVAMLADGTRTRPRIRVGVFALAGVLVVVNLPSFWQGELVDAALERDQDVPQAWTDAADDLRVDAAGSRVLQFPGAEFGAYRWGYTVDPPLPFLSDKPVLTRDLLPLGSPGVMDLLYALDGRVQTSSLEPESLAPVSRLLGANQIWLNTDQAFERFRTPRPTELLAAVGEPMPGLGDMVSYGEPQPSLPSVPVIDEYSLATGAEPALPPVLLRDVDDPVLPIRAATDVVVLDGSGDGIVDAAAAGLIVGDEAVLLAADAVQATGTLDALPSADGSTRFIVTDSHRDRTEQRRSSQDSVGMTESGGAASDLTGEANDTHQPLPRAGDGNPDAQTIATLDGGLVVQASSYGEPFALLPEARAAMAVDGDQATAWQVGTNASPIGESINVSNIAEGELRLVQVQGRERRNWITSVVVTAGDQSTTVPLDERSLVAPGQSIPVTPGVPVTVRIDAIAERPNRPETGDYWVGFAEMGPVAHEVVRPPKLVLDQVDADDDVSLVFRRERVDATDRWRSDPESHLSRRFELPVALDGVWSVRLRLNPRANDAVLNELSGVISGPTSLDRLIGVAEARAASAFDGRLDTAWTSPFHAALGSTLTIPLDGATPFEAMSMVQPVDDQHSVITEVSVQVGDLDQAIEVPPPDSEGRSQVVLPSVSGDELVLTVTAIDARITTDRRYGDPATLPVSLSEIEGLPISMELRDTTDECRSDLLWVDDVGIPLRIDVQALLRGEFVDAELCGDAITTLSAGSHDVISARGLTTGIDVDLVSFSNGTSASTPVAGGGAPAVSVNGSSLTSAQFEVEPCPDGCWLVFGQGFSEGWEASANGAGLGPQIPISGGFNGWWLEPSPDSTSVSVDFAPQGTVRLGLAFSLLSVAACLAALIWARARRRDDRAPDSPGRHSYRRVDAVVPLPVNTALLVAPVSRRTAVIAAALLVAGSLLLIGVGVFWHAIVVAAVLVVSRRPRMVALGGVALLGILGLNIARRAWLFDLNAGAGWPIRFSDLHELMAFAIIVVAAPMVIDGMTSDGDEMTPDGVVGVDGDDLVAGEQQ